jgi:hypothetical protein
MDDKKLLTKCTAAEEETKSYAKNGAKYYVSEDGMRFYSGKGDKIVELRDGTHSVHYNNEMLKGMLNSVVSRMTKSTALKIPHILVYTLLAIDDPDMCLNQSMVMKLPSRLRSVRSQDRTDRGKHLYFESAYRDLVRNMWFCVPQDTSDELMPKISYALLYTLAERYGAGEGKKLAPMDPQVKELRDYNAELFRMLKFGLDSCLNEGNKSLVWDIIGDRCSSYFVSEDGGVETTSSSVEEEEMDQAEDEEADDEDDSDDEDYSPPPAKKPKTSNWFN